jgi:signal transduction histidine kinase/CheY-like chemotaxis protein
MKLASHHWLRQWGVVLGVAAVYYITAKLGQYLAIPPGFITPVYAPSGLAVATLLIFGFSAWPGLVLGAFVAATWPLWVNTGQPAMAIAAGTGITVGSVLQAVVGAYLLRRWVGRHHLFDNGQNVFKFTVIELMSCMVSPTFGATTMYFCGFIPPDDYGNSWLTFWLGDGVGALVVAPLVLVWADWLQQRQQAPGLDAAAAVSSGRMQRAIELAIWTAAVGGIGAIAFGRNYPIEYLLVPLLVWAAFRFGQRFTTLAIFWVAGLAIIGAIQGTSSFNRDTLNESLLLLQAFVGAIAVTNMVLSAAVIEREQAEASLVKANAALEANNEILEAKVDRRTAELRQAKDKAEVASQAKSEFLANMSHELRTPLNGILGYAQIMQRTEPLSDRGRQGMTVIQQCGDHLLTLINDVLDLAKIEAQRMELFPSDFHLPALLQGVVEICRIRAEQKGVAFHYLPDPEMPLGIHGDDKRLRQVLINLLGNAVKFTDQGSVTFRVQCLPTAASATDSTPALHRFRFEIEDTGIGMSPDFLSRLFLPFEQNCDTAQKTEGTGLGLTITHKIVQLMGSDIHVRSDLGQGSCFTFDLTLPAAQAWAQAAAIKHHRPILKFAGPSRCVLIVDDKWENRSVVVNLLQPLGFEMLEAEQGAAALTLLEQHHPDLIVTDLMMPVMDGFALMEVLRSSEQWHQIPVIASSASVFESDQHRSFDVGAVDFLAKPIQAQQLLDFLERHLNLAWVYGDDPDQELDATATETTPDQNGSMTLKLPSSDRLTVLYDLAKRGRVRVFQQQLTELATEDPTLLPFVETLQPLAQQFQLKAIQQVLQAHLAPSAPTPIGY